ncbi:MAG: DUF938 domain-containing protein [Woeseiaceae bacterium]|nr:DUF938 domain-containing protein [Woeseiaceae bacterium]
MTAGADKPFAPASARNAAPILEALEVELADADNVFEIGAGTGQHAVHFAQALPGVHWQPSDLEDNLPGIRAWRDEAGLPNLAAPVALDVRHDGIPDAKYAAVYSANTAHIMAQDAVTEMFRIAAGVLEPGGVFCLYGPFREGGRHNAPSNAAFDESLKAQDPAMGIRDLESLDDLAAREGLVRRSRYAMPANNQLLVWEKSA